MSVNEQSMEKTYYKVFFGLLVFTVSTFFLAEGLENKFASIVSVLLIATVKASLVALFFMHLKFEGKWKYLLLVPTCILAIVLVVALLPDIARLGPWKIS